MWADLILYKVVSSIVGISKPIEFLINENINPENVDGYEEVKGYLLESPLAFKRK